MRVRGTVVALVSLVSAAACANWLFASHDASAQSAGPLNCSLNGYKAAAGLTAAVAGEALTLHLGRRQGPGTAAAVRHQQRHADDSRSSRSAAQGRCLGGARDQRRRRNIASSPAAAAWTTRRAKGSKRTASTRSRRRCSKKYQWDPFWDAPLNVPGGQPNDRRTLGLPRKPEEIHRATATYKAQGCDVKTDGTRLTVAFPGVTLGVFAGELQFTVYKGSNLIRQEVIAKTDQNSVAYKYDAGLKGLAIGEDRAWCGATRPTCRRATASAARKNEHETPVRTANRLMIAERGKAGSIAAFPPPHNFFWARESDINLGYNWYRKDSDTQFSFGIRQAEKEESPNNAGNFALYSARPGTLQHMPVFYYASAEPAEPTREAVLAFTHGDHYKPVAGYKVMVHHYHMRLGPAPDGGGHVPMPTSWISPRCKALGIDIVSPVDNVGMGGGAANRSAAETLKMLKFAARRRAPEVGQGFSGDARPGILRQRARRAHRSVCSRIRSIGSTAGRRARRSSTTSRPTARSITSARRTT